MTETFANQPTTTVAARGNADVLDGGKHLDFPAARAPTLRKPAK